MRFTLPLVGSLAFSLLTVASLQADLVVVQDVDAMGQHLAMTLKTKGNLTRIDVNPQMSIILDATTGDMKTLMHDQKMFMAMNASTMKGMLQSMTKTDPAALGKPEIKALGNKEKIDGYDTEEYLYTAGTTVSHVWLAKDYPHLDAFRQAMSTLSSGPIGKMAPQMQMDVAQLPGMPLKTVIEINGKPSGTSLVKSVEEKDLPATDFAPPADYTTFSMPAMQAAPAPATP